MGVHRLISNYKPSLRQKKKFAVGREKKKVRKLKRGLRKLNIEDAHLLSTEQIKQKMTHPKNNISVSGKRRRKVLKRLRHSQREKNKMEVEEPSTSQGPKDVEMAAVSKKSVKSQKVTKKSTRLSDDIDMEDDDTNT